MTKTDRHAARHTDITRQRIARVGHSCVRETHAAAGECATREKMDSRDEMKNKRHHKHTRSNALREDDREVQHATSFFFIFLG